MNTLVTRAPAPASRPHALRRGARIRLSAPQPRAWRARSPHRSAAWRCARRRGASRSRSAGSKTHRRTGRSRFGGSRRRSGRSSCASISHRVAEPLNDLVLRDLPGLDGLLDRARRQLLVVLPVVVQEPAGEVAHGVEDELAAVHHIHPTLAVNPSGAPSVGGRYASSRAGATSTWP